MIPVVVLVAEAGSGKDALGGYLEQVFGAQPIGFADPLKQMGRDLCGFNDDQLYGPSASRNAIDPALAPGGERYRAMESFTRGYFGFEACKKLFPDRRDEAYAHLVNNWLPAAQQRAAADNGLSARFILQTLGTEWGRALQPDLWIDYAYRTAMKLLTGGHTYTRQGGLVVTKDAPPKPMVVVTDGRFPNEAVEMRARGCVAFEVMRVHKADTTTTGVAGHASEALMKTIPKHFYNGVLVNDDTLEMFQAVGADVIREALGIGKQPIKVSEHFAFPTLVSPVEVHTNTGGLT